MNTEYWLRLIHAKGIGPIKGKILLDHFDDISEMFKVSTATLKSIGLSSKIIFELQNYDLKTIKEELAWLEDPQHHLITLQDSRYPPLLKEITDPPLALFVAGDPEILNSTQLGIVGSRNPSYAGLDNAFDFAKTLAQKGFSITSGLALGIDTESHKGALKAQGKTIAVLGTGIDKIYPASNKGLAKEIIAGGGAIISELTPGVPAKATNFPKRNRIISGLSIGTLVIEATIRSGSLITARLAAEQNREVFAIPGSIHSPLARGCHQLIRQGAKLVETAQDVLEELEHLQPKKNTEFKRPEKNMLASDYEKLLHYVDYESTPIDVIVERSGLSAQQTATMLLTLELQNYVKSVTGGYIKNVH